MYRRSEVNAIMRLHLRRMNPSLFSTTASHAATTNKRKTGEKFLHKTWAQEVRNQKKNHAVEIKRRRQ